MCGFPVVDDPVPNKLLSYNRANRAVAILCNHQVSSQGYWSHCYIFVHILK